MRTPEPEPPIRPRPATVDDHAAPNPDFLGQPDLLGRQVTPAEQAVLAPVQPPLQPPPVAPQRQWIPRQIPIPDVEAVRRVGRAVADGAAQTAASVASGAAQTAASVASGAAQTAASVASGAAQTAASVASGAAQTAASVASGAAQTARTAAYRGSRPIVNLGAGIGYFFRGAGRLLGTPALWPYAVAPIVLLPLVMLGLAHTIEAAAAAVIGWLTSFAESWGWIHDALGAILLWGVRIGLHFVLGYLVLPLSIIVGAPCYVLLARRLEQRLGPIGPVGGAQAETTNRIPSLWRACGVAVRQAILITIVVQLGWLLLVPLLLVPGLNVFVAVGAVAVFNGFLVGLLMLAIPLHHHGTSTFRGQLRTVWRHRASVIGFGATSGLLLGLPFTPLRALVAPMVFTGAVLLYRRMCRADAAALGATVGVGTAVAAPRLELPAGYPSNRIDPYHG